MERPTCETCSYYDAPYCKRHPPSLVSTPSDDEFHYVSAYPANIKYDFCGEHPFFPAYIAALQTEPREKKENHAE